MKETDETLRLLAEADQQRRFGNFDGAIAASEKALAADPKSQAALQFLSTLHFTLNNFADAAKHLEAFSKLNPASVDCWHGLGLAYEGCERADDALAAYRTAAALDHDNPYTYLFIGSVLEGQGEDLIAAQAYSFAVDLYPKVKLIPNNPDAPQALKFRAKRANDMLTKLGAEIREDAASVAEENFKGADFARFQKSIWRKLSDGSAPFDDLIQQPMAFYQPGLDFRPWFERGEFDWATRFEAEFDAIRAEMLAGLDTLKDTKPYLEKGRNDPETWGDMIDNINWSGLHFYNGIEREEEAFKRFPHTAQVIDSLPLFKIRGTPVEVLFSCLQAGQRIPPHWGASNARVTVHLPLVVPKRNDGEGPWLRAGHETRPFIEGQMMAFDDSFEHEALNPTDSVRVVLIVEAWHPALAEHEKKAIEESYAAYNDWMAARNLKLIAGIEGSIDAVE